MKLRNKLVLIAKEHSVVVKFQKIKRHYGGYYEGDKKTIIVTTAVPKRELISNFMHELSHVLDHRDGLFKKFYSSQSPKYTKRRLALRAERHTDRRAAKLCKVYFDGVRYLPGYSLWWQVCYLQAYYADGRKMRAK